MLVVVCTALPRRQPTGIADSRGAWTHDCQVPWHPESETQPTTEKGAVCND